MNREQKYKRTKKQETKRDIMHYDAGRRKKSYRRLNQQLYQKMIHRQKSKCITTQKALSGIVTKYTTEYKEPKMIH